MESTSSLLILIKSSWIVLRQRLPSRMLKGVFNLIKLGYLTESELYILVTAGR